jgi:hypothetical protein
VFFAFGISLIFSFFGLAVGAAATGPQGATSGVQAWSGIWSLVTVFFAFLCGGWLAAKASSTTKADGRLHALVTWGLGTSALFYFLVTGMTRIAAIGASMTSSVQEAAAAPTDVTTGTAAVATWALIAGICGLIGALIGGRLGVYRQAEAAPEVRKVA